ncbi:RraA family protein [Mesorhizobium sp. 2RAF21]|uniref:RraA family protein n=1 Tax=Mesorhizobium sp. 2RAF21 TaxID=3232995 RepID=UPI003F9BC6D1
MYTVNDMPAQIAASLALRLEQVETATVGHFLYDVFVHRSIVPLVPTKRVAGTAVTIKIPHADSTLLHYLTKMIRPGDIVLVDRCGDDTYACWGGGISNAMSIAGLKAAVIDGPATDLSEIQRLGLPVWARGLSPRTTRLLDQYGEINTPITVGGKTVYPGDAVLADECGIIVLDPAKADAVADRALQMQAWEVGLLQRLRAGEWLPDITGATDMVRAKTA